VPWEDVLADQLERDRRDSTRAHSPLRPAEGAIVLDTGGLTLDEVVARLLELVRRTLTG
jgi:cytidylate kinase